MVSKSVAPRVTRILPRGDWMNETGSIVEPAIPEFLGKLNTSSAHATRLDLANWIMSAQNPLTARVFVNRVWRQFFGSGLVRTLDDFGSRPLYEIAVNLEVDDLLRVILLLSFGISGGSKNHQDCCEKQCNCCAETERSHFESSFEFNSSQSMEEYSTLPDDRQGL